MIGIVVPAHNEEALLGACLASLLVAAEHPGLAGEAVTVVVVLDQCRDRSAAIAARFAVDTLSVAFTNVGRARHAGALHVMAKGARWLAFTDADTVVGPDWLMRQCASHTDAVCGGVRLANWRTLSPTLRRQYLALRRETRDGHHIHGANFGVDAAAYRAVGGFPPLASHEDIQLVANLERRGFSIAWLDTLRVITSGRCDARAPEGLGARLNTMNRAIEPDASVRLSAGEF